MVNSDEAGGRLERWFSNRGNITRSEAAVNLEIRALFVA